MNESRERRESDAAEETGNERASERNIFYLSRAAGKNEPAARNRRIGKFLARNTSRLTQDVFDPEKDSKFIAISSD